MTSPVAVVDLGSNSTRLLIARLEEGRVEPLERRSTVTRLGQGVDANGRLAQEAMERVFDAVGEFKRLIDEHGANDVVAVATSAARDSANGDELRGELRERFGFDTQIISGDEEAQLTFLGATAARSGDAPTLVIDIGGGSTEFVIGTAASVPPDFHVSTQAGSVRQTERHLHHDPPPDEQLLALRAEVGEIIDQAVPARLRSEVAIGVAVAGTATQLAGVDIAAKQADEPVDGYRLERRAVERMLAGLAAKPLRERRSTAGLDPDRAPTIVAGAAILLEALHAFELDAVEVSVADILHGVALRFFNTQNG